jgi:hypothetical protein
MEATFGQPVFTGAPSQSGFPNPAAATFHMKGAPPGGDISAGAKGFADPSERPAGVRNAVAAGIRELAFGANCKCQPREESLRCRVQNAFGVRA